MNLFTLLDQTARRFADRDAVFLGTDKLLTWAELRDRASALAAGLAARYEPGSRIAIFSENCAQTLELLFGIWAAGCAAVPVNYKLHPKEVVQIVGDAQAGAVFVSAALAQGLNDQLGRDAAAAQCSVLTIGSADYEAMFTSARATRAVLVNVAADVPPDSLAWLFYTSGTTGRSKGAMLSHRNLLAMTIAHLADVETLDEHCSQIHAAPMSHGSGIYILPYVARGARQVVPSSQGFDPAEFLDLCDAHPGCGAFLAPTMVQRLRLAALATGRRPKQLRTIVYGGGPMYVEELKKSLAAFGQVFVQIYGQGEAPMTITVLTREDHASGDDALLGSVGHARTGVELRVVGEDGRDLPAGEVGEIICRGDVVMGGYWRNPAGTAEALRGGWLYTGDMGALDSRGTLTLRDRSKDLIISGGSNIYPREVEEALLAHPGVLEACVIGERDEEWGETVLAFIVRAAGSVVSEAELDAFCLERIARFKRPKRYRFVDALPKNSYGKVLKRELRETLRRNA